MIEGHPIPQDITGFQFRLIGDMTVKQFAYLAVSFVFGWVFFALPENIVMKVLLAAIPVGIGLILTFVPIQGIPADTMLILFFKALLNPNQYVYNKTGLDDTAQNGSTAAASSPVTTAIHTQEPAAVKQAPSEKTQFILAPATTAKETIVENKPVEIPEKQPVLSVQIISPPEEPKSPAPVIKQEPQPVQQPIAVAQPVTPQPPPVPPVQTTVPVKKTPATPFMPPDVPNLISGLLKDSRENVLPNILVEIKDKEDNPVRAFKTNALGQFASATPLLNGTYTITFEDPKKQHRFDIIDLNVTGAIIPSMEITSIDEREDLRKSLFQP